MTERKHCFVHRMNLDVFTLIFVFACLSILFCHCHSFKTNKFHCEFSGPCRCMFPNYQGYDLSSLDQKNAWLNTSKNNLTFYFHPCSDESLGNNSDANNCFAGASVCLFNSSRNSYKNIGFANESSVISPVGLSNPVTFVFKNGENITNIHLECNPSEKTSLEIQSIALKYELLLKSPAACLKWLGPLQEDPVERHLSTGSVLVVMFVVLSSVYFVGGALALKYLRGAEGIEMIPNYEFWMSLPGLVKEGFLFAVSGCQTPQAYDRI